MSMQKKVRIRHYDGPAGGWGSVKSLARHAKRNGHLLANADVLARQNKPQGFACVSCAWAKPADPHPAEFCENGAKATFWELTTDRCTPEFFARHSVTELRGWGDYELESQGRLTHPMRFNHDTDRYEPVSWDDAFTTIGRELAAIRQDNPRQTVFYASGRASLETSYMYQLMARLYGNNNLPDSSNMCHESTSVALPESIGISVGTVRLDDFRHADAIFFFGQNVGTNSPRMLHELQKASQRGAAIVAFNPLRERGLERFTNPQAPVEMIAGRETRISSEYYQVKAGGDIAAIAGLCKFLLRQHEERTAAGRAGVLDEPFIKAHTHGFEEFRDFVRSTPWEVIEAESGLSRHALERAAMTYATAQRTVAVYGMGLTQHKHGVSSIQMLVNLLLLKGNIGRRGAGICPVRGHSNVQGQRTVGISEKPELVPLDRLEELYGFKAPREEGMTTVDVCQGIIDRKVAAFVGLGGNFIRAVPERSLMEEAWPGMRLTVQVATKLNRSHLFNGEVAFLLPCLGRIEIDKQATGPQIVTMEDSTACFHSSRGYATPASPFLRSEPAIVAGIAKATLQPNPNVPWDAWVADYSKVRDAIEQTWPEMFREFNKRMDEPGGFPKPLAARERIWETESGKANFKLPKAMSASFHDGKDPRILRLMTLRSNDQFNTTIYGYRDRFRGIEGTRMVVMMNADDMLHLGIVDGDIVELKTAVDDGVERRMSGFRAVEYNIPPGCCAAYYPECNVLIPLWQHAEESKVPAAKSIPVRVLIDEKQRHAAE